MITDLLKEHYSALGKKGGTNNGKNHTHEHFVTIGRAGAMKKWIKYYEQHPDKLAEHLKKMEGSS